MLAYAPYGSSSKTPQRRPVILRVRILRALFAAAVVCARRRENPFRGGGRMKLDLRLPRNVFLAHPSKMLALTPGIQRKFQNAPHVRHNDAEIPQNLRSGKV